MRYCPTKPGNDVNTGEITVNYVTSGCKEGVCDYKRKAARDEVASSVTADETTDEDVPVDQTIDTDLPADQTIDADDPIDTFLPPGTSENVHTLKAPWGINCKGSSLCRICKGSLRQIQETLALMGKYMQHTLSSLPIKYAFTESTIRRRRLGIQEQRGDCVRALYKDQLCGQLHHRPQFTQTNCHQGCQNVGPATQRFWMWT
ncbi:uncharacterized protein J4E92_006484 [Alternaria infectoria]|uniref:uncharacterized protein n=1 Tax=Alternaria infectoria TaxID=45303 RepID=UPI0022206EC0|nr:uncharacterized protein J4E92_006484 [Alternaria infectoria]KAI4925748.1 hypothetical protein J4E92_006484 [Alternaria infectoria]